MEVKLIAHTPEPEKVIAASAKLCYSSSDASTIMENLSKENIDKFLTHLMNIGHASPIEHATFTFSISGISRACSHQLVRHRMASYSQKSQRYVKEDFFKYVVPVAISNSVRTLDIFCNSIASAQEAYDALVTNLMDMGRTEKEAIEDARYVLPNACQTEMVVTMNTRSLLHFFEQRCCNRAQSEIRSVANAMLKLCKEVAPVLFGKAGAPCVSGTCTEGSMSCKA